MFTAKTRLLPCIFGKAYLRPLRDIPTILVRFSDVVETAIPLSVRPFTDMRTAMGMMYCLPIALVHCPVISFRLMQKNATLMERGI